jgi:hypothetical protein
MHLTMQAKYNSFALRVAALKGLKVWDAACVSSCACQITSQVLGKMISLIKLLIVNFIND